MPHILRTKIIDGRPMVILQPARPSASLHDTIETSLALREAERMIENGDYLGALQAIRGRLSDS